MPFGTGPSKPKRTVPLFPPPPVFMPICVSYVPLVVTQVTCGIKAQCQMAQNGRALSLIFLFIQQGVTSYIIHNKSISALDERNLKGTVYKLPSTT